MMCTSFASFFSQGWNCCFTQLYLRLFLV
jgi:hypothetical protein